MTLKLNSACWSRNQEKVWLLSSIELRRNLEGFFFTSHLQPQARQSILEAICGALHSFSSCKDSAPASIQNLSQVEKEHLYEHFLLSPPEVCSENPESSFFLSARNQQLIQVLSTDHLQALTMSRGNGTLSLWRQTQRLSRALNRLLSFAFSEQFGFLTAKPELCGTALIMRAYLHVPAIRLLKGDHSHLLAADNRTCIEGLEGREEGFMGDLVVLRNRMTWGVSEQEIFASLQKKASSIVIEEESLRKQVQKEKPLRCRDQVARALALLKSAKTLSLKESFDSLSALRLGLDIGWIEGMSHSKCTQLLYETRRGAMFSKRGISQVSPEEASHMRAQYFHRHLQRVHLRRGI